MCAVKESDSEGLRTAPNQPETSSLCCLARGQAARVVEVTGPNRCRLMEMGFIAGTEVQVVRHAAFGGPLEVHLRSYRLSLRRQEAEEIRVQTVAATP